MNKRLLVLISLVLLVILILLFVSRGRQQQVTHDGDTQVQCNERVNKSLAQWRAEGKAKVEIEKLYQRDLAKCSGVEDGMACIVGTANFDYARLGRKFLSNNLTPSAYLAGVRDRSRKLSKARVDKTWAAACTKGDKDGDLVPDDRDRCPGTEDLVLTDDSGCPVSVPLPPAPSVSEVQKAKDALKAVISPACQDAPVPTFSEPLQIGLDKTNENIFLVAVTKVTNQPAECMIFYEVSLLIKNSSFFSGSSKESYAHFVFRPSDNIDISPVAQQRQIFRIRKSSFALWNDLVTIAIEPSDLELREVRVRVMNGNGLSSGWSATRSFRMTIGNRFFEDR